MLPVEVFVTKAKTVMLVTDRFLLKLTIAWFTVVQRSNSYTFLTHCFSQYRGHLDLLSKRPLIA